MSMFGYDTPKQRIYEELQGANAAGATKHEVAVMVIECLEAWLKYEMDDSEKEDHK